LSGLNTLPPEYNATPVCNQELTEYHELKDSHKMFFDNVLSRYITLHHVGSRSHCGKSVAGFIDQACRENYQAKVAGSMQ
jgi:hypothetical protein